MKILKRSVPLWAVIVSVLAITGVAIAAIMVTWDTSTHLEVVGVWGITVYDTDHIEELTSIEFGTLNHGDVKRYPEDTTKDYYVDNTGDYQFWVSWTVTGFPTDVTIEVFVDGAEYNLPENTVYTGRFLDPGDTLTFYIKLTVSDTAAFASYNPVVTWSAHDSSTG